MTIPLPTRPPTSTEIEAARQLLERIYQAPSATTAAGSAGAQQAAGVLVKGASVALLTAGIWVAMEQPAGLPVLQEHLILHGPRGYFDQMERMLAERGGDTQAVRALRTTVMGMLENGQVHSAGLILGESLAEAQRGGLISRHANPVDLGFDAALRHAQQHPPRTSTQTAPVELPAPPPPVAGSYATVPQPPALSSELQTLRDRINSGQYANSQDSFDRGVDAFNGLIEQVNAQRQRGVITIDDRALQVASDELVGRRMNSVLSQYLRNAADGGPLPSATDMDQYLGQVREFNAATEQRYGRPMFDPDAIDRIDQRLDAAIGFRADFNRFLEKATSGQFANSADSYSEGVAQLEALRLRSNRIGAEHGVLGMTRENYEESLFQLEGRRINSVEAYVGRELIAGNPIDPQITESLVDRAENLNARRRAAGGVDFFDARAMDNYRDNHSIADYRQDYREFNAQVLSGQFANSQETYAQGRQQLEALIDRANTMLRDQGVQPLPQRTLQETEYQLDGRRINSQLSHLQREVNEGRSVDPQATRELVEAAEQLNQNRRNNGGGDLFEPGTMRAYRDLLQTVEQSIAPPTQAPPQPEPRPEPQPQPQPEPAPNPNPNPNPDRPPTQQPTAPERDIEREWGEEFGNGEIAEDLRREAERQGVSQEEVIDHARRNPNRTANEILAELRDGNLSHGGTPPGNRPPGGSVAAPGQPDDSPPLDNLTIVRPRPDPLLPLHAIDREQRMRPPEPMISPDGQRFDVMGVERGDDGNLRVRLRPEGQRVDALPSEAMFEMRATAPQTLSQPGNAVSFGREPWLTGGVIEPGQQPGVNERSYLLRDPQNPERTTVVPESRAAEIFTPVGREVTYQGETWRFQALQSPGWQPGVDRRGFQLVDPDNPERTVFVPENRAVDIRMRLGEDGEYRFGDVRHGVIRLQPMQPDRDFTMPLQPGMSFEARLRDREMEGPYRITVGENGELTATGRIRNGTEVTQRIEPSDIAPRYVDVRSPDFNDSFQVDSFIHREANTRNRAIATEPTGLPLRDPAFGNLDGRPSPQLALGAQSLETQADFIRRNAGNLEPGQSPSLTVFNIAFSNEGEARRVLDAISDFRDMHPNAPIRIVAYEPSFRSFQGTEAYRQLQEVIERDKIQVEFFGRDPSQREVIHAKGVVVNDQVLFSTGAVIDGSRNKADISVQLPPEGARAFNAYLNEAVIGNADVARRQELAAAAAREGVLINDPEARLPYIARAQDGLIRGAERELTVSVSELRNPETTRAIIERAEAGVNVQVQFREMDPESRRLLADAQQRLPNLRVEDVSAWQPRPHYNVIIADGQQAYVGTAYLWQNQQDMLQHGRSFENGVLLQGDAVQRLQAQMEALRILQPPNPGQRLLGPGEDPTPGPQSRGDDAGIAPVALRPPSAPQPGDAGFEAYTQSRNAVERLNTGLNIAYAEPSEKLTVAAATLALQQNLRVDEVALNPPSATLAGGTTAFVIERGGTRESDRYGTLPMQVAMQTPLEEGYRRLGEVAEQNRQQTPQVDRSQQQALDEEQRLGSRRMA
jgi:hypothetical protein